MPKKRKLHDVDFVIEERATANGSIFLVRWTGYSCIHDSWTPYVTKDIQDSWRKRQRVRKWSKFLRAERIIRSRTTIGRTEYLVKFYDFSEPEWTPFVNDTLLRAYRRKPIRLALESRSDGS